MTYRRVFLAAALFAAVSPFTAARAETATAIFAGGCFWCIEKDFEHVAGVKGVVSGYTGGELQNPTYRNHTGHLEAVEVTYDPSVVSYRQLVDIFWRTVDPLDAGGQFCDRGHAYTTAVFVSSPEQKAEAEASMAEAATQLPGPIVTPILPAARFWNAEDYHQDYYRKNPVRYQYYRWGCGRNQRVEELWGDQAYRGVSLADG